MDVLPRRKFEREHWVLGDIRESLAFPAAKSKSNLMLKLSALFLRGTTVLEPRSREIII
jgi:hypothetical protein